MLPYDLLIEIFYRSLDVDNKSMANNIVKGALIDHTYEEGDVLLNMWTETNRACHTSPIDMVSSTSTRKLSNEKMLKEEAKE